MNNIDSKDPNSLANRISSNTSKNGLPIRMQGFLHYVVGHGICDIIKLKDEKLYDLTDVENFGQNFC